MDFYSIYKVIKLGVQLNTGSNPVTGTNKKFKKMNIQDNEEYFGKNKKRLRRITGQAKKRILSFLTLKLPTRYVSG